MFKTIFLLLLFAHILGEFYFRRNDFAERKKTCISGVLKHGAVYACICLLVSVPVFSKTMLIANVALGFSHLIIDLLIFIYNKYSKKNNTPDKERIIYIIDQGLHIISICVIAFIFAANHYHITVLPSVKTAFEIIGMPSEKIFSGLLALLFIWKPANVTIKKLLFLYKPIEKDINENIKKTGGSIGLLERLIILVLLLMNQYAAMGLVLTAKSIARYDKISRDQAFAEYYLLGTLLSTIIVVITYLMVF